MHATKTAHSNATQFKKKIEKVSVKCEDYLGGVREEGMM